MQIVQHVIVQHVGVKRSMVRGAMVSLVLLGAVVSGVSHRPLMAQVVRNQPMFTDTKLGPRFIPDPTVLRGLSGGEVYTEAVAGRLKTETGSCVGFISDKPDHEVTLTSFFNYLNLQVASPGDTVLLVRGPGGTWCNDDRTLAGPSIAGQWMPGDYQIWVGSINSEQYLPYELQFSEAR